MKISTTQYAKTLMELTEKKSEQEVLSVVKNFAEALKKEGQLKNAGKIMEKFSELYNKANGIIEATIVTSRKSESLNVKEVEEFIKKKYSAKKVEIKIVIDEKIKGGIVIKVGDEVMDASVSMQLKKLQKVLSR